jgi:hypothetical protein
MQYYTDEARAKVEEGKARWTPELQAKAEKDWSDLYNDVRQVLTEDAASERAQALLNRRDDLIRQFTQGDPQVTEGLNRLYADRANWPPEFQQKMSPWSDPDVQAFFAKAEAARRRA